MELRVSEVGLSVRCGDTRQLNDRRAFDQPRRIKGTDSCIDMWHKQT